VTEAPPGVYSAAMIKALVLLSLPAFLAPQEDPARAALQRLQDVLGKAKTLTLVSQSEAKAVGELVTVATTAHFKDARVAFSGSQKIQTSTQAFTAIVNDTQLHLAYEGQSELNVEVPKEYSAELRKLVVLAGVVPVSALTQSKVARDQALTPEKFMTVSDLKLSDDGMSLSYTLKFLGIHTLDVFGGTFACTLRFDPATGKMLRRTLNASTADGRRATITETYELTLDADLPDALFAMPERKDAPRTRYKPTTCMSTQCPVDLADAKEGRWMTYLMKTSVSETRYTLRVVGKIDADWLIESWFDTGALKYAWLYRVGPDRLVRKAWAAAEGETEWTSVPVKEAPKPVAPDTSKLELKESDEKKQVRGGAFDCKRIDSTISIGGRTYASASWYSKDVWKFVPTKDQPGGLVAMESGDATTTLDATGEDAKPTLPLPKE
jgi:hypothetical protein